MGHRGRRRQAAMVGLRGMQGYRGSLQVVDSICRRPTVHKWQTGYTSGGWGAQAVDGVRRRRTGYIGGGGCMRHAEGNGGRRRQWGYAVRRAVEGLQVMRRGAEEICRQRQRRSTGGNGGDCISLNTRC